MLKAKPLPSVERIRSLLDYVPATGRMYWATQRHLMAKGDEAGYMLPDGSWMIKIDGLKFKRGRLAWAHYHGVEPTHSICHIDRWSKNDRIANLRDIPLKEHMASKGSIGPDPDPDLFVGMLRSKQLPKHVLDRKKSRLKG